MLFSERQKLEKEYYKWLDKNKNVKPSLFSVITFLTNRGNLLTDKEKNDTQILEIALNDACAELFFAKYPNLNKKARLDFQFNTLKRHFKDKAKEKNNAYKTTKNNIR